MQTLVSSKSRIVIPAALRKKYGIEKGTRIHVSDAGGQILLRPVTVELIDRLRGKYKGWGLLRTLGAERSRDRKREDGSRASARL
jgi:AbrB family looped-hinge helix DNA binding protein